MYTTTNFINPTTSIFIPSGKKYLASFKEENNNPLCILYDIENKIHKHIYVSFDPILTLGTVLYGTLIDNTFICENINYYKNKKINEGMKHAYKLIEHILNNYIKYTSIKGVYNFKLPYMTNAEPIFKVSEMNYNIYGIVQLRPKPFIYKLSNLFGNFIVYKHKELNDVYGLYVMNDKEEYFYCNAFVNDIKTSYLLRKLFKNKKNYKNIEYSDEENVIEKDNIVEKDNILEKEYITCLYLPSYKKWKPYKYNNRKIVDTYKKIKAYT
tara:strand:+ start:1527 stop:2330 length:804 start_codon:yes stop_codon:yes gene_type:complete